MKATRGSLATRLAGLEERAGAGSGATPPRPAWDEADWLAVFEHWGAEGTFDHEPDFPAALALFRTTLAGARTSAEPPFDPPPGFMAGCPDPRARADLWRAQQFPALGAALDWLAEMLTRLVEGIPPVSEAEFADLAAWFRANDDRLYAAARPSELLDVGGGRHTCCANVRWALAQGPRAGGAGRGAEDIRRLRARYGP